MTGDANTNNNFAGFTVNLFLDSDGDGIPDWWEIAHGLDPYNPNDALLDNDGDGLSNRAEYLAGTDPNDRNSYLRIQPVVPPVANSFSGGIQMVWGSSANLLYSIERSTDLRDGFVPVLQHGLATPPQNSFLDSTATNSGPYFYRIRVE